MYLARDPVIDRNLAIKTIRMMGLLKEEKEEFLKRFYQEAKAAGNLSHPNIVTIHDAGFDSEKEMHYIVMEYIPGKTLKEIIQQKVPLSYEEKALILEKIADALSYAHSKGIVHRDIKPANVIISGPESIKITDFGIAKIPFSQLTTDGQYLGTPTYMSPEQVLGKPVDKRSDIFSFGIVAYELFSYQKPFTGNNLTEVSHKIAYENPIPLKEILPDCPEVLLYIVDKSLSKDPDLRFQDAKEISKELKNFVLIPKTEEKGPEDTIILKEEAKKIEKEETYGTKRVEKPAKVGFRQKFLNRLRSNKSLQFLSFEIYPKWVFLIIFIWVALWSVILGALHLKAKNLGRIEENYSFINPVEIKGWIEKGRAFLKENEYEKALNYFEKALLVNPSSPYLIKEVSSIRTLIYYNLKTKDTQKEVEFYLLKGEEALRKKDYTSAKIHFSKVLEIDPENSEAKDYLKRIEEWKKAKKPIVIPEKPKVEMAKVEEKKIETPQVKEEKVLEPKMEIRFKSPIPEGHIMVSLNGKQIIKKSFNFYVKKGLIGKEFKGGYLEEPLPVKAGQNSLKIWITKFGKDGFTAYQELQIDVKSSTFYKLNLQLDEKEKKLNVNIEETYFGN